MLVVGVTLLLGLDWVRSGSADESRPLVVADANGATPTIGIVRDEETLATPEAVAAPHPASVPAIAPAPTRTASDETVVRRGEEPNPRPVPIENERPIAAASTVPRQTLTAPMAPRGEIPDDYVARRSDREAGVLVSTAPSLPPSGEIPDSYVFTPPRRDTVPPREPAVVRPASAAPVAAANVVRQPGSVVESLGTARGGAGDSAPIAAPAPPPAATAVVSPRANDETAVHSTLQRYARAYGELDARAARAVWPSVNERALAKAFGDLASQQYVFDECDVSIGSGGQTATASCRGHASYVTKIGNQGPRSEARTWNFDLRRDGDAWKIAKAETRR
jgi:hypothetical protein